MKTKKENFTEIANVIKQNIDKLEMLKIRWQDEREYEDFADYVKVVKEMFSAFKVLKVAKSFTIHIQNDNVIAEFKMTSVKWTLKIIA